MDPLSEKYVSWSPYNYVLGNPIKFIDPDGRRVETEIYNQNGKKVGEDKNGRDGNVAIVDNQTGKGVKNGTISPEEAIGGAGTIQTTYTEINESLNVLQRTIDNGGDLKESSVVQNDGKVIRGQTGSAREDGISNATLPPNDGSDNTSIHSHPINASFDGEEILSNPANSPGPGDPNTFFGI